MSLSTTVIKRFAFDRRMLNFFIGFLLLISAVQWVIIQEEDNIVLNVASVIGDLGTNLIASKNIFESQAQSEQNKTIQNVIQFLDPSTSFEHFETIEQLNKNEYGDNLANIAGAIKQKNKFQQAIILDKIKFLDIFVPDNANAGSDSFWRIRVNTQNIRKLVHEQVMDISLFLLVVAIIIFSIFLYIISQFQALNLEGGKKRKQLDKMNKDLRLEQDEVLKHQTELMAATNKAEEANAQMRDYTEYLENSKRAMMNMLQDIDAARKEADKANNAKSIFLASMSHGFRTPMNGVLGMIDICLGTKLNKEQKDYLETAHSSGIVLMSLLNDILDYSKIEAGKLEIEEAEFDFYRVIHDIAYLFRQKIYEKGLELVVSIDPTIPHKVIGDSTRIRQIISNIVGNSVKFTAEGNIHIEVFIKKTEEGDKLEIQVSDTGTGMTELEIANLFKPFTQADASITRKYGGTGLGLTISKRLVELLGGRVWAESIPGKCTTFFVELPLLVEDSAVFRFNKSLKSKSLLVIPGTDVLLENIKLSLQSYGVHYTVLRTLADLKKIEVTGWDGCLLDFKIENAQEFIGYLNRIRIKNPKFKIIGLYNYLEHELAEELTEKNHIEVIYKPLLIRQFHDRLTDIFKITKNTHQSEESDRFLRIAENIDKNINVLIAEDNTVNQKVIKAYFDKLGFKNVTVVENGQQALDIMKSNTFDIIFMDIQMPVMDGLVATMTIRTNEKLTHTHTPIVALTAHSFVGDKQRCFDAGVDDYLGKPIQLDRLIICLEKWTHNIKIESEEVEVASSDDSTPIDIDLPSQEIEINYEFFNQTREALGEAFPDMVASFINDALEKISLIEKGIEQDDVKAVSFAAHQLKSSSASFGIRQLSEISKQLDDLAKSPGYLKETASAIFKELVSEFEKAKIFLEEHD